MKWTVYLAIAAVVAVLSILGFQRVVDPRRAAEIARLETLVTEARRATAIAHRETAIANERLDSALSLVPRAVTRWRTVTDTLRIAADATPHDSIAAIAGALAETRAAGDSVVRACGELEGSCSQFRAKATAEIAALNTENARLDSLNSAPRPGKRWNLSISAGYGLTAARDSAQRQHRLENRFFVGASIGRTVLSW